ncbi:8-amino-7-oxononanoate synthase [Leptobacterium sp. I13]|uniref:aminotransferase class I/II-fold pyridoxal phosphate-dependent enzyme n=1 Tax=Leptobacterium meishanense TaxID=3128904 RepID=UPI0030EF3FF3
MNRFPKKLTFKLASREKEGLLRKLPEAGEGKIDFSSNDYLGLAKSEVVSQHAHQLLKARKMLMNGATGSRLLSGNYPLYKEAEKTLCEFHDTEAALIYNSGYDANLGLFSSVPQRGDIILYDELAHASIRDGISMSKAKAYKFRHNKLEHLQQLIVRCQTERSQNNEEQEIYVVTESVFSMDGDSPNLKAFAEICLAENCHLIVDEAHAIGVYGENGQGLVQALGLEKKIFARVITFGKALGCHGAAILGTEKLKDYLINFSRSFIYTTGLPPHSLATTLVIYKALAVISNPDGYREEKSDSIALIIKKNIEKLHQNIAFFNKEVEKYQLQDCFIPSTSAIHCCIISGNENVKTIATIIQEKGFDVKPILSPTVPQGQERLRICLHSYNSEKELSKFLSLLATFTK